MLSLIHILGSYLQGHPDMKHIPGVDMSSGSLGQGISAAAGMALSAKLSNDDYRVYTPVSYTHLAVPKYNGETGDPILYVEFQDFLGMNYVDNPEAKKELQDSIAARTGKSVEIHMLVANKHQHTNLAQITVDDALRENIHMDIVVEEDPDEES